MEVDDNWTQELRVRREPSGPPTPPPTPEAPDPSEAPTRRVRPRSISDAGSPPGRGSRPLDRREIQELELEEPPTARLGRSLPAQPAARPEPPTEPESELGSEPEPEPPTERQSRPRPDAGDDQLTIRLDRPD